MPKKYEIFNFGIDGIPEELAGRLVVPPHIKLEGHLLRPYIKPHLIPTDLDLVLLEDLNYFYQELTEDPFGFLSTCFGLYIAEDHTWMPKKDYEKVNMLLKKEYGIEVRRALLLPQERVNYWTLIHEALHDVFNHLSLEQRARIIGSAISSYDTSGKLNEMLDLTHLNITHFDWDIGEIAKIRDENERLGRRLLEGFDHFYTFGNLKSIDQLQAVDEFISNFYANNRGKNRWSERHLALPFLAALQEVGYQMDNLPIIKN